MGCKSARGEEEEPKKVSGFKIASTNAVMAGVNSQVLVFVTNSSYEVLAQFDIFISLTGLMR
jgi:hypothetical protein